MRYFSFGFSFPLFPLTLPSCLASIQYRMHPSISKFTSKEFYDSKLVDAPDMATRTHRPWHANPLFPPYALLDVWSKQESRGTSWCNRREAETALALYIRLTNEYPQTSEFQYTVCVVSPYAAQIEELKRQFENALGTKISERVAFHMIDASFFAPKSPSPRV